MLKTPIKSSVLIELKELILALERDNIRALTHQERKELDILLQKDIPRLIKLIRPKEK